MAAGKQYFFQIADPKWIMYQTIELLLSGQAPAARTEEVKGSKRLVRELTLKAVRPTPNNRTIWRHAQTILKVYSETYEDGVLMAPRHATL